jgi:hypothetical protein
LTVLLQSNLKMLSYLKPITATLIFHVSPDYGGRDSIWIRELHLHCDMADSIVTRRFMCVTSYEWRNRGSKISQNKAIIR